MIPRSIQKKISLGDYSICKCGTPTPHRSSVCTKCRTFKCSDCKIETIGKDPGMIRCSTCKRCREHRAGRG